MRINIIDKQIKYALNLTSEELVHLMRLQPLQGRRTPFQIMSPVLIACGENKHEVDIVRMDEAGKSRSTRGDSFSDDPLELSDEDAAETMYNFRDSRKPPINKKQPTEKIKSTDKIPPFTLETELTPELFNDLTTNKKALLLLRIQNIPAYAVIDSIRVNVSSPGTKGSLVMKIDKVSPIVDLLKTQLTESSFYDTFIVGKSEEFFESTGVQLDNIVALVGILRKENESDNEMRIRVKEYLKIRIAETTNVDDRELKALIQKSEEVQEIERSMDEAKKKEKKSSDE